MKNTIKVLGIIAFVAVIGFAFVACEEPGDDLNGTWTAGIGEDTVEVTFNNGNYSAKISGIDNGKGTYSVKGDELTITMTHMWDGDSWESVVDTTTTTQTVKYSVDGNKLTLTANGQSIVYTKK